MPGRYEIKEILQRISDFAFETTYKKPKHWLMFTLIGAAAVLGVSGTHFIENSSFQNTLNQTRQEAKEEADKKDEKNKTEMQNLQEQFTQTTRALTKEKTTLEQQIEQMRASEPAQIKSIRAELERVQQDYQKIKTSFETANSTISSLRTDKASLERDLRKKSSDHDTYVSSHSYTDEEYAAVKSSARNFEQRLDKIVKELSDVKTAFDDYMKTHPEHVTLQAFSGLQDQIKTALEQMSREKAAHEQYVREHSVKNTEYDSVKLNLSAAEEKRREAEKAAAEFKKYKDEHSHSNTEFINLSNEKKVLEYANINLSRKIEELNKGYFESLTYKDPNTGDYFFYFDITYGRELPPESVVKQVGDWAGPKHIGRYISRDLSKRFDAESTLMAGYSGRLKSDYERLWVKVGGSGTEWKYYLVIEKGSQKDEHEIAQDRLERFIKSCRAKK